MEEFDDLEQSCHQDIGQDPILSDDLVLRIATEVDGLLSGLGMEHKGSAGLQNADSESLGHEPGSPVLGSDRCMDASASFDFIDLENSSEGSDDENWLPDAFAMASWHSRSTELAEVSDSCLGPIAEVEEGAGSTVNSPTKQPPKQPKALVDTLLEAESGVSVEDLGTDQTRPSSLCQAWAEPGAWSRMPWVEGRLVPDLGAWCQSQSTRAGSWESSSTGSDLTRQTDVEGDSQCQQHWEHQQLQEEEEAEEALRQAAAVRAAAAAKQEEEVSRSFVVHESAPPLCQEAMPAKGRLSLPEISLDDPGVALPEWAMLPSTSGLPPRARPGPTSAPSRPALRRVEELRRKRAEEILAEQELRSRQDEPTFRPKITALARRAERQGPAGNPRNSTVAERAAKRAAELQEREERECTFQPQLSRPARPARPSRDASGTSILSARVAKMKSEKEEKEQRECTFRPSLVAAPAKRSFLDSRKTRLQKTRSSSQESYTEKVAKRLIDRDDHFRECTFHPDISPRSRELANRVSCTPSTPSKSREKWHDRLHRCNPSRGSSRRAPVSPPPRGRTSETSDGPPSLVLPRQQLPEELDQMLGRVPQPPLSLLEDEGEAAEDGASTQHSDGTDCPADHPDGLPPAGGPPGQRLHRRLSAALVGSDPVSFFRSRSSTRELDGETLKTIIRDDLKIPAADLPDDDVDELIAAQDHFGEPMTVEDLAGFVHLGPEALGCEAPSPSCEAVERGADQSILDDVAWCLQLHLDLAGRAADPTAFFGTFACAPGLLDAAGLRRCIREELRIPAAELPDVDIEQLVTTVAGSSDSLRIDELVRFVRRGAGGTSPESPPMTF